ncbi:hypothetical protein GY03_18005 [Proteus vulgaris]|uniref:hypothetical protein n=1 Tax=Proteus vulgaris TaxID=585 RepID=UPI0021B10A11|nr:hypothetical protein [Proteus vulgaris]MCT6519174.1 hypothetical protein [Proteus vulgaris]
MTQPDLLPAKQGHLDGLCGIYSIVNALNWLYGNNIRRRSLFRYLLEQYHQHWSVLECITDGICEIEMDYLLNTARRYNTKTKAINISMPFRYRRSLSSYRILQSCQQFLEAPTGKQAIILCDQHHWSVITQVTDTQVRYFDSCELQMIPRDKFMIKAHARRTQLIPSAIYWLNSDIE